MRAWNISVVLPLRMQVARMSQVLKKFQGCLVGALLGDVLGEKFEGLYDEPIHMSTVTAYTMDSVPSSPKKSPLLSYTDDTAMTRAICRSLVERKTYDNRDMAEKFVEEYFNEPDRGYGAGVTTVFRRLRDEKPADETLPAKDQFDGMGSYGNGAAMRISPVALYAKDYDSLVKYATQNARITHAHMKGINGAIIQAAAVHQALNEEAPNLDVNKFVDFLVGVAEKLERKCDSESSNADKEDGSRVDSIDGEFSYAVRLKEMKTLLTQEQEPNTQDAYGTFGNGIRAEQAVPAAIFAFLHKGRVSFEESINFAISLGGDTDTIASMAGAISGAYWGLDAIPRFWREKAEAVDEAIDFAEKIYELRG